MLARECATVVLERMRDGAVCTFIECLGCKLEDILLGSLGSTTMSYSKKKEKMWTMFYQYRSSDLISSWKAFIASVELPAKYNDPWFIQVVARLSLENYVT